MSVGAYQRGVTLHRLPIVCFLSFAPVSLPAFSAPSVPGLLGRPSPPRLRTPAMKTTTCYSGLVGSIGPERTAEGKSAKEMRVTSARLFFTLPSSVFLSRFSG